MKIYKCHSFVQQMSRLTNNSVSDLSHFVGFNLTTRLEGVKMHRILNIFAGVIIIAYCIFSLLADVQHDTSWIIIAVVFLIISVQIDSKHRKKGIS